MKLGSSLKLQTLTADACNNGLEPTAAEPLSDSTRPTPSQLAMSQDSSPKGATNLQQLPTTQDMRHADEQL